MLLDISEILRNVGSSYRFELDEEALPLRGMTLVSPVGGHLTVSNSGSRLVVRGAVWGDVVLQCGHCLQPFAYPVDAEIEEDFDMADVQRLASRQKVEDESMTALFTGAAIDLNELISQEFTLNLPINPICSPECEPPCPRCGKPAASCECRPGSGETDSHGEIDPRWQPLLDRMEKKTDATS